MFSENQYIESIRLETNICKHLHSKTSVEIPDYRPTENQRSVIELLQYLTTCVQPPMPKSDFQRLVEDPQGSRKS